MRTVWAAVVAGLLLAACVGSDSGLVDPESQDPTCHRYALAEAASEPGFEWNRSGMAVYHAAYEECTRAELPAPVRFLSCEPLLGPVDLRIWLWLPPFEDDERERGIDWVIVGGESGPGHRNLDLNHARSLRDQCADAGVPFFFKQVGGQFPTSGGDQLDGETHHAFPLSARREAV